MKKLYILLMATLISNTSSATHLMGGELTVEHLGGADYVIHFTAYRDTIGIPFALTATFEVYDSTGAMVITTTNSQLPISGSLMPGYPYGVEVYYFHDTITVPGPGAYTVEWWNCCRNAAIQNLTNPLGENMFLTTSFIHVAGTTNSTPEFLAPPVTFLPINQPWQYNSLPFDPDGDSLSWSIDTPLTSSGLYAAGWVTPSAATAVDAFVIDPVTGQINWTPDMLGNFVASILVEEFSGGNKIGEIRRDYQMIVVADTTKCPRIANFGVFPTDANGHAYMNMTAGSPHYVFLFAEDPEGDQVEFMAFGEPLFAAANPATFVTTPYNTTNVAATFSWTPDASQIRNNPYLVMFRTRDQLFTFDETVLFYVNQSTGLNADALNSMDAMYPNPSKGLVFVPLELDHETAVSVSVFNISGSKVAEQHFGKLPAGNHVENLTLELSSGTYFIKLYLDGKESLTRKIVIAGN
jgi:hypothetical protein